MLGTESNQGKEECNCCGDCCMQIGRPPFMFGSPEEARRARELGEWHYLKKDVVARYPPQEAEKMRREYRAIVEQDANEMPPDFPPELLEELDDYWHSLRSGAGVDRQDLQLPCFWFDRGSARCKHYEWRPAICRNHYCQEPMPGK
jgi:Fe-S-cluster containining protein